MTRKAANLICAVLVIIAAIASVLAYPNMSEQVPTHWNAAGEVDGYSGKLTAVLIGPLGALFMWGIMLLIPVISPKGFRTTEFSGVLNIIQVVLVAFMIAIGGMIIAAGFGHEPSVNRIVPVAIGVLLIVLGNYMGKIRKNFFIGIRTPWTLASDEVWAKTHRLGGYLFVAAGVAIVAMTLFGFGIEAILFTTIPAALIPVVYSFIAYRRIEGFSDE